MESAALQAGHRAEPQVYSNHQLACSEAELRDLVAHEIATTPHREMVVMSGHFMLFVNDEGDQLVPGVIELQQNDIMRERIERRVGIFPTYTLRLSAEIARAAGDKLDDVKFLLLINDWQYVPTRGGSAPELRKRFYDAFEMPALYQEILAEHGFSMSNMLPCRKHPFAFPETWLKYRFQKAAEKLVKQGRLAKRVLDGKEQQGSEVSFIDADGNYKPLLSCGVTGCAGEVTEMVAEVYNAGYRFMLMFAPGECCQPVRTGVEVALGLYGLPGMKVVIVDPGGSGEMSVEEIYEKLVNVSVYEASPAL